MAYRYIVRTVRGAAETEHELHALSQEGWDPVNFARVADSEYEIILRGAEIDPHAEAEVLESLEASASDIIAPPLA